MFLTRIRTPLRATLVLWMAGLVGAFWLATDGSSAPMAHNSRGDHVVVVTKTFGTSRAAWSYFGHVADGLGRERRRLLSTYCPLEVPGALEFVLQRGPAARQTILLVANGDRVYRISRLHSFTTPETEVRASLAAASRSLTG